MASWSAVRAVLAAAALAGLARAGHHFIRLAILAALGLAGLYMLHMLAQDYNKITNRPASRPAVAAATRTAATAARALFRAITKRDVSAQEQDEDAWSPAQHALGHVLKQVLVQDPLGCARKLVCQLSAAQRAPQGLRPYEAAILRLVERSALEAGDDASDEFRAAQLLGKSGGDPARCAARYTKCLVEPRGVLKFLQAVR